jgi:hypothetical protein
MTLGTALLELEVPEHRPGFFDELRDELGPRATGVARPRLLLVAAAVTVVAAALAFGLTRGSNVAAAAQVRAAVERALASTGSISGISVSESSTPGEPVQRVRFVLSSTGAFRVEELGTGSSFVYDPVRNTETSSDHTEFRRIVGLSAGPPDEGPTFFASEIGLGSVIAALAQAHDPTVENVTYEGRPAWLLRMPTADDHEQEMVTIDRATGLPVRRQWLHDGHLAHEQRIEHLRVSATEPRITAPAPARGQSVSVENAGFRHTSLAGARAAAGYSPLVPKQLPRGFTLAEIVFASSSPATGGSAEAGGINPPSQDVISLAYRRGFDEIVVATRRTGPDPSAWTDPLPDSTVASRVTFTGGALAGESGYLAVAPDEIPHVWAAGPDLVVTIAGTVDSAELLEVANSLQ